MAYYTKPTTLVDGEKIHLKQLNELTSAIATGFRNLEVDISDQSSSNLMTQTYDSGKIYITDMFADKFAVNTITLELYHGFTAAPALVSVIFVPSTTDPVFSSVRSWDGPVESEILQSSSQACRRENISGEPMSTYSDTSKIYVNINPAQIHSALSTVYDVGFFTFAGGIRAMSDNDAIIIRAIL